MNFSPITPQLARFSDWNKADVQAATSTLNDTTADPVKRQHSANVLAELYAAIELELAATERDTNTP